MLGFHCLTNWLETVEYRIATATENGSVKKSRSPLKCFLFDLLRLETAIWYAVFEYEECRISENVAVFPEYFSRTSSPSHIRPPSLHVRKYFLMTFFRCCKSFNRYGYNVESDCWQRKRRWALTRPLFRSSLMKWYYLERPKVSLVCCCLFFILQGAKMEARLGVEFLVKIR